MIRAAALALALAIAGGCSRDAPPDEGTTGGPRTDEVKVVLEPGYKPGVHTGTFHLIAEAAPVKAGEIVVVKVAVTPGDGYKLNPAYDTRLTIYPPDGVTAKRAVQTAADATRNDSRELAFAVELSGAASGAHQVTGSLAFAVCTRDETACLPMTQPLDVAVDVR